PFSSLPLLPSGYAHDSFYDLLVPGAATKIAGHLSLDTFFSGTWLLIEYGLGRHDYAGCTEAALQTSNLDKRLLQRMEFTAFAQALNRDDLFFCCVHSQ